MPLAPGSTGQVNAASGAAAAVASRLMPPGGAVSWHASPPSAGSSHSARFPAAASAWAAPGWSLPGWPVTGELAPPGWPSGGAGRADRNSSEPSGRKAGLSSPSADLVSRAARTGPAPTYVGLADWLGGAGAGWPGCARCWA